MAFVINEECVGCTACVKVCPTEAITGESKLLHVIDPLKCIDCGACGIVCPEPAIEDQFGVVVDRLKPKERPKPVIDLDSCTGSGCRYCVDYCPFDCLEIGRKDEFPPFGVAVLKDPKGCVSCYICEDACIKGVLELRLPEEEEATAGVES